MCEVAILSTDEHSVSEITNAAMVLYQSMRTSLGMVSIEHSGGTYDYDVFKSLSPDRDAVSDFIEHRHDDAVRFILHGRLATHGSRDIKAAHPIQIDCSECELDYVVHNGVIYDHGRHRSAAEADGHGFRTDVDTEVIAHEYGEAPAQIDDIVEDFEREPCYILMQEDRMLIHAGTRYQLTEDGRMAQARRTFGPDEGKYKDLIMKPVTADDATEVEQ